LADFKSVPSPLFYHPTRYDVQKKPLKKEIRQEAVRQIGGAIANCKTATAKCKMVG
jgi:hypothetical protein